MHSKTQAIVLHVTHYADHKSIVHLYTRDFGRVDYTIYGVGSRKGRWKKSLLEPLTVLDIEVNHQATEQLQRIDDVQISMINNSLAADIRKRTICLFIAELLYKVLKHPMRDAELFDFLILSIQTLEQCDEPQNFHLAFMLRLTQFLGFYPDFMSHGQWLDLRTGGPRLHPHQDRPSWFDEHPEVGGVPDLEVLLQESF